MDPVQTEWPLGKATCRLVVPEKFSARWSVGLALEDAVGKTDVYVFTVAGAIALCDPDLAAYVDKAYPFARRAGLAVWGSCVVDYLTSLDPPATEEQILAAGRAAVQLCDRKRVTQAKIEEAQGFSSPQPAASTSSSSTSSATGDSLPAGWAPSTPTTQPG